MKPGDSEFGKEGDGKEGKLTTVSSTGEKTTELIPSVRGKYIDLFECVFQNVRNDIPFPVKEEEVLLQLEILESKAH